ncbi:hypothetical protein A2Z67_06160 [Candidatus Woesebacteria bacterium RBG_13_36_22]|uniref:Elp3/MiaA/NifB-like radical SAM core domain-containing protein n=1 Tax=Candidatus Woesebacteria bacterium RBG_13_36_22 TaxID=1802478 RepID=A0A1F7X6E9_9BACT|nr:MAG: hypothetical protein A2Z67_06160 [Candidatus Woesebacteria bacterium RBG_13_36_22]
MDRAFVQFHLLYKKTEIEGGVRCLQNGFSSVWSLANPVWVYQEKGILPELPVDVDEYYISVWGFADLAVSRAWAKKNPDKKFILGGPVVLYTPKSMVKKAFAEYKNVELLPNLSEDIFGIKFSSKNWGIKFPDIQERVSIYSYHLGDSCYWSKCTFCTVPEGNTWIEPRDEYDVEMLWDAPKGIVWLATPAIPPSKLDVLLRLNYSGKIYRTFIRADKSTYDSLEKIIDRIPSKKMMFNVGVEFPSNKMLSKVNKGVTVSDLTRILNLIYERGQQASCSYLTNLHGIGKDEVEEAKSFFKSLKDQTGSGIDTRHHFRKCVNFGTHGDIPIGCRGIHIGFYDKLTEEEEYWDTEWMKALKGFGARLRVQGVVDFNTGLSTEKILNS